MQNCVFKCLSMWVLSVNLLPRWVPSHDICLDSDFLSGSLLSYEPFSFSIRYFHSSSNRHRRKQSDISFPQAAITGGKVMLIGMGTRNVMMPLSAAALREVDIHGSFRYANTYPTALALLSSGQLENVEKLITHRFGLQDTQKAFEMLERGVDERGQLVLKIMVGQS